MCQDRKCWSSARREERIYALQIATAFGACHRRVQRAEPLRGRSTSSKSWATSPPLRSNRTAPRGGPRRRRRPAPRGARGARGPSSSSSLEPAAALEDQVEREGDHQHQRQSIRGRMEVSRVQCSGSQNARWCPPWGRLVTARCLVLQMSFKLPSSRRLLLGVPSTPQLPLRLEPLSSYASKGAAARRRPPPSTARKASVCSREGARQFPVWIWNGSTGL